MTIEDIARLCSGLSVQWTDHMLQRIFRRCIGMDDVMEALRTSLIRLYGQMILDTGGVYDLFYV
jgi:hypothetical protein